MRTKKKFHVVLAGFVGVLLIIGGVVLVKWHQLSESGITIPVPPKATKAILALTGVHQTATKDGVLQWELEAESAELESRSGRMLLKAPQVNFFREDGTQVRLTAEQGVLDTGSNDMQVQGNVRIVDDRYTLSTEQLNYRHAEHILSSEKPVHISGQNVDLHAATMSVDLNTNQARFEGRVRGILNEHFAL